MAFANSGSAHIDKWPGSVSDKAALQNGAKLFVNYCMNCHGASYLRYKNLLDLGLTEQQVKENLMFTSDKIGELMRVAARSDEQKLWFGATPPDLTIVARARGEAGNAGGGADWIYTYLRSFYRDANRPTGWNNLVFENVGMPHVLWELQGERKPVFEEKQDHGHAVKTFTGKWEQVTKGSMTPAAFDQSVGDLVNFLQWMGEPGQAKRTSLGWYVLAFLAMLSFFTWRLSKAYWKDVK